VTLKAVAAKVGRTHANLLHHFGSARAAGELARSIAGPGDRSIAEAVARARAGEADAAEVVDGTFDAFDRRARERLPPG
jgi:hypothetical protein